MELIVLKSKWGNRHIFVCFFFWMNFVSQPNNYFFLLRKEKVTFSAWNAVIQIALKIKWMSVEVNFLGERWMELLCDIIKKQIWKQERYLYLTIVTQPAIWQGKALKPKKP